MTQEHLNKLYNDLSDEDYTDKVNEESVALVSADWKDINGLAKSFEKAIEALGGEMLFDPAFDGTDAYAYVIVKK